MGIRAGGRASKLHQNPILIPRLVGPHYRASRVMVGVPRFELGSKRPKRPSIGQTNPYALGLCHGILPMNFTQRTSTGQVPNAEPIPQVLLVP